MGMVRCEKHGLRGGGGLCCRHLLYAISGLGPVVTYRRVVWESTADGKATLTFLVCEACMSQYRLGSEVDLETWFDESRFPWAAPVCGECLGDFQMHHPCAE
ncbi:MAG: hypothetical protein QM765_06460 [Myxococcales bacterium]